jgi:hypothetical protein
MKENPFEAVARYCDRELQAPFAQRLLAHSEAAMREAGLVPTDLPERLGQDPYLMLFTVVVEDFTTRPDAPGGVRVADAYLKRHGWKLTPSARKLIQRVRDSVMGLYEVTGLKPGHGLELRDLLLDGPDFKVAQPRLAGVLPVGCLLGARVLQLDEGATLSGGVLPFEEELREQVVTYIRDAAELGDRPIRNDELAGLAPHISNVWLKMTLAEAAAKD